MITYKDIRARLAPDYQFTDDEDLSLRLMVRFDDGRQQGVSALEVDRNDGTRMLQLNTPVVPLDKVGARQCLEWNLFSTVGGLALTQIDDEVLRRARREPFLRRPRPVAAGLHRRDVRAYR